MTDSGIDNLVDLSIASLLQASLATSFPTLPILAGLEDNNPELNLPYLVVYSVVDRKEGREAVTVLTSTVEYVSISGLQNKTIVQSVMAAVEDALNIQPSSAILAEVTTDNLAYISWEATERSRQEVGDRRHNTREMTVFAQPV
jgi:hypothetical protein